MFKAREQAYKRGLIAKAASHLGGEDVRVIALAMGGFNPWLTYIPYGIAVALVNESLIGSDNYLPTWAGYVGIAIFVATIAASYLLPRRLVIRTDQRLYVFKLPARKSQPVERPLQTIEVAALPSILREERSQSAGSETLWPYPATKTERHALAEALMPANVA